MKNPENFPNRNNHSLLRLISLCIISVTFCAFPANGQEESSTKDTCPASIDTIADYAWNGRLQEIKSLIEKDNQLIHVKVKNDETLLTIAAYKKDVELAKYVMIQGIDINACNRWGMNGLLNASVSGSTEIAKLLIEKGADVNVKGGGQNTPLLFSIYNNHADMVKLLLDNGADIGLRSSDNLTPIANASYYRNFEIIKALVEHGGDVNFVEETNSGMMHNVSYDGSAELIDYLVKKGTNVNLVNQSGCLPLHNAVQYRNIPATKIMSEHTTNLNQAEKYNGNTPLHIAVLNGDLETSKILVAAGADAKKTNLNNYSPVDLAVKYGYDKLVSFFASANLTDMKSVNQAKMTQKEVKQKINTDEVKIWHTGHSGWAMQFEDKVIVFDYWANGQTDPDISIVGGNFKPAEFRDKKIYVFASHDHTDHYDTTIFAWKNQLSNIKYIYGFKPENSEMHSVHGYKGPSYVYIDDNQTSMIDDIVITTIKSDDTGQGFLLETNGMKIFHPGDHAEFNSDIAAEYKKEIDFLSEKTNRIDIAFIPVTGCPSSWEKEKIVEGFLYVLDKLNPAEVFPMHASGSEYLLKEFAQISKEKNYSNNIECVENKGDHFLFNKTTMALK